MSFTAVSQCSRCRSKDLTSLKNIHDSYFCERNRTISTRVVVISPFICRGDIFSRNLAIVTSYYVTMLVVVDVLCTGTILNKLLRYDQNKWLHVYLYCFNLPGCLVALYSLALETAPSTSIDTEITGTSRKSALPKNGFPPTAACWFLFAF